ncbi:MAG: DUF393 domain-containing protein [Acidobacteria bacterium]|nr:DUF393 domain-containing protein [Acidobacteriota bacterium]
MREPAIILFDGECSFCNASVRFILDRDPKRHFRFCPSQTEVGRDLLERAGLPRDGVGSIVLLEDGQVYTHSTAVLRIARKLRGLSPLAYPLRAIPRWLRDGVYKLFAANRHRWKGRIRECRLPSPEERKLFLDTA